MAHVAKRNRTGRTEWIARWIDPSGRERSKSFRRRVDAEQFLVSVEAAKLQGAYVDPRNSKLRFVQVVDDYKKTRRSSPATQARDDSALSVHVLPCFGDMPLGAIDRRQVQEWVFGLEQKGLAPSTIKREFQALQKVFTWAVDEEELIVRNPCRRIRFPSAQNEQSTERRVYRPEEIEKLYEAFDPRYRAMVLVGCYAGLRIGEQAALRIEDVSFAERRIHVRQGLTESEAEPRSGH